nr:MAG TPA: hypothetical protein [Bacteriophage sp.]
MIFLACIVTVSVVLFVHMGLSEKIQEILHINISLLRCVKCLSFQLSLIVLLCNGYGILSSICCSFIFAYLALWIELLLGYLSTLYDKLYEQIYTSEKR